MQILSFLAMLVIFVAVVVCPSGASEGYCAYRDEMMVGGAGLMMALMGVKVVNRGKYKKKLDRKIAELEKEEWLEMVMEWDGERWYLYVYRN